ncbi:MAG: hypothetical protein CBE24_05915 [bacterium TMED264]|nr:MAG: hypothetical protein CBE24_05915 [bacterium TMED264]
MDELGINPFEVDCVAGGPPCQGFSNAGPNIANDPRNKLYRQYLRVIRKIKPKSLFCDNVLYTPYLGKKLHPPIVEL